MFSLSLCAFCMHQKSFLWVGAGQTCIRLTHLLCKGQHESRLDHY